MVGGLRAFANQNQRLQCGPSVIIKQYIGPLLFAGGIECCVYRRELTKAKSQGKDASMVL